MQREFDNMIKDMEEEIRNLKTTYRHGLGLFNFYGGSKSFTATAADQTISFVVHISSDDPFPCLFNAQSDFLSSSSRISINESARTIIISGKSDVSGYTYYCSCITSSRITSITVETS